MEDSFVFCQNMNITATDSPNLTQVTSFRQMFYLCSSLVGNPSFGNWNTSSVTTTYYMFGVASQFNQPIGSWNVSNVTDMDFMFDEAHTFNQSLAEWNTSKVTTMEHMFHAATSFNSDIGNWDVSKVTNMKEMFLWTPQFNQNLGNWNLTSLVNAENMLSDSGLNCQNYDSTLYGWKNNSHTPNSINFGTAAPQVYTHPAAVAARNSLMNTKGWTITGDTHNPN
ncbi:BspA family leucine-rich repeat surface protein [Chryseobacterium sp.]|uniref:BspA family leucine-rich repeat surface protein n=1 Tax=Chryseobacterium sp. TaxID=1871047 RepID=UPI00388F3DEC